MKTVKKLDPINFAYVMATGGVSFILKMSGWDTLSTLFLILACSCYFSLIILFGIRAFFYKNSADLFEYLAFGASTNILALRFSQGGHDFVGSILAIIGTFSITVLLVIFCTFFLKQKNALVNVCPDWLIIGIACHTAGMAISLFVQPAFLLLALCFWFLGLFVYLILMILNLYRIFFLPLEGRDLRFSYWMCLGAAAIAAVGGSQLLIVDPSPLFLDTLKPFIEGMVFVLWGCGTVCVPLLILMLIFQYIYYKMPVRYHPEQWAIVFALAMYTAATGIFLSSVVPILMLSTLLSWCVIALLIGIDFRRGL